MDLNFEKLKRALPANVNPDRFRQAAIMAAAENPKVLLECTPVSVFSSILQAAQIGYNLGSVHSEAYLVPYRDKKLGVTVCKLTPSYIGMRRALIRSGAADVVRASVVHENDNTFVSHHPPRAIQDVDLKGERGEWLGVLACAYRLKDNGDHHLIDFVYLNKDRIMAARAMARDQTLWDRHPEQFWQKTGIRALVKMFPLVNDELVAVATWDNEETQAAEPTTIDAEHTLQGDARATGRGLALPEPELVAPPEESPQATKAKRKTRKKKATTTTAEPADNGTQDAPSFGFS
jgi:phage RecT family recombinase